MTDSAPGQMQLTRLEDFDDPAAASLWHSIDDVVMGGVSRSSLIIVQKSVARFSGSVSLERGGGFASIRTVERRWATAGAVAFVLRVQGDGKRYKFTARVDDGFDGVQYQTRFIAPRGQWLEVTLPVESFNASFRGRLVADAPPLAPANIRSLGFMISDRQAGPFELLIDWVAIRRQAAQSDCMA